MIKYVLILPLPVLPACDNRRMQHRNSAQQAVFRPVQLPVCPIWRGVCRAGYWDRVPPPPDPLLPLRPIQSSHCGCAPALWSQGPGEASDGGGGVQMWDGPRGKECYGRTPVTVTTCVIIIYTFVMNIYICICIFSFMSLNVLFRVKYSGDLFHHWLMTKWPIFWSCTFLLQQLSTLDLCYCSENLFRLI